MTPRALWRFQEPERCPVCRSIWRTPPSWVSFRVCRSRRTGQWYRWNYRRWSPAATMGAGRNCWRRGQEVSVRIAPGQWRPVESSAPLPTGTNAEAACDSPWHPANRERHGEPRPALSGERLAETLARGAARRRRARERQSKALR